MRRAPDPYDVVVVGGGPAGLSAALWLARYRRRVRVVDAGGPRNDPAWAVHGYPGLPDLSPTELRRRLREQAQGAGAQVSPGRVEAAQGAKDAFALQLESGDSLAARRLLLAYGLRDIVPEVAGLVEAYGSSVFHCPDCDGPSMVGASVGVLGADREAAALALFLLTWAERLTLLTDGAAPALEPAERARLESNGVAVRTERVVRLVSREGRLRHAELDGGTRIPLEGVFFHLGSRPGCALGETLGCRAHAGGHLAVDRSQETSVAGVYAAGDLAGPPYLAVQAAAEGVRAALSLHRSLIAETRHL